MTLRDYFISAIALTVFIVFPAWGLFASWRYLRLTPKERRARCDAACESHAASAIGGAFGVFDKIIRPSVEYQIEAQEKIIKEDEKGGE